MTKADNLFHLCFEASEYTLTEDEALAILALTKDDKGDQSKIRKAWSKASSLAHPDKGGSHEEQLRVNAAYALLKKTKKEVDREERHRKFDADLFNLRIVMRDQLKESFDIDRYLDYFKELSGGKQFTHQFIQEWPKADEDAGRGFSHSAGFIIKFYTPDKKISFELTIYADALKVMDSATIGSGTLSYNVLVETHGFFANKKQKLHKKDWGFVSDHAFLTDPQKLFPKAKLKNIFSGKTSKRAFKKRDMFLFMKERLNANDNGDFQWIPIGSDADRKNQMYLVVYRTILMRLPTWDINGLYKGGKRIALLPKAGVFRETEAVAEHFLKVKNSVKHISDDDKMTKMLLKLLPDHEDNILKPKE